ISFMRLVSVRQSVRVFREYRQRQAVNTVFKRRMHIFAGGFAVYATRLGFAEMTLPGFLGKFIADIVRILANLPAQFPHFLQYLLLLVTQRHGNLFLAAACRNSRRHQRFLDSLRIAYLASDKLHFRLPVEIGIVAKPALEFMALIAMKRKADHGLMHPHSVWRLPSSR